MNKLPPGWTDSTLGILSGQPQYGWTTKASRDSIRNPKLLRTTDITRGAIKWDEVPFCSEPPPDPTKYLISPGDILISRAGSVGASALIKGEVPAAVFASYLIRFRRSPHVDPSYVAWYLQSNDYWRQIADSTAGIAMPNVNAKKLAAVQIPLAPAREQERIVAAIEKLFSHLDAGLAILTRIKGISELRPGLALKLRRSILAEAFAGRLIPQNSGDEPAAVLVHRITQTAMEGPV